MQRSLLGAPLAGTAYDARLLRQPRAAHRKLRTATRCYLPSTAPHAHSNAAIGQQRDRPRQSVATRTSAPYMYSCPILQPKIRACQSWHNLQRILEAHLGPVDADTLATIVAHLPRVLPNDFRKAVQKHGAPLFTFTTHLLELVSAATPALSPRDTALVLWALAKLEYPLSPALSAQLFLHAQALLPSSTGQDTATYAWAAARMDGRHPLPPAFLPSLEAATLTTRNRANGQDLGMLVWALGTLHYQPSPAWVANLCQAVALKLPSLNGQNISNIVWGLAVMPVRPAGAWLSHILAASTPQLHSMTNQNLVNILWALARIGHRDDPEFVGAVLAVARARLPVFNTQDMANTVWALAHLKCRPNEDWTQRLLAASNAKCSQFSAQQLSNLMWGLSELGVRPSARWVEGHVMAAVACGDEMQPRWVADILGALVEFDAHLPEAIEHLVGEALQQASMSSHVTFKRMVRHLAALRFQPSPRWMEEYVSVVTRQVPHLNPDQICTLFWTFAKVPTHSSTRSMSLFVSRVTATQLRDFNQHQTYRLVLGLARLQMQVSRKSWAALQRKVKYVRRDSQQDQYIRMCAALKHINSRPRLARRAVGVEAVAVEAVPRRPPPQQLQQLAGRAA